MRGKGREGGRGGKGRKGEGREGRRGGREREGKGKVASWLLGEWTPLSVTAAFLSLKVSLSLKTFHFIHQTDSDVVVDTKVLVSRRLKDKNSLGLGLE